MNEGLQAWQILVKYECMLEVHFCVLIWCRFTNVTNTSYTHSVCILCIVFQSTVSKRPYWLQCLFF